MAFTFWQSCFCFVTSIRIIVYPDCSVRKPFRALLHAPFYTPCLALVWRLGFTRLGLLSIKMRNLNYFWSTSLLIHACPTWKSAQGIENTGSHVETDINLVFLNHGSAVTFMINF